MQEELGWVHIDCLPVPTELRFAVLVLFLSSSSDRSGYIFRVEGPIYCVVWGCTLDL